MKTLIAGFGKRNTVWRLRRVGLGFMAFCVLCGLPPLPVRAAEVVKAPARPIDFTALSLEELKDVMIVSASKKPEKLTGAAAAISVLTRDDIRRSGATSLPDLLRYVPGLQVAQINASTWAVSARGFNHRFANNLLVMIDGRSVYTPLFSGVYWHVQDMLLEDIERIEIIRGPGASLWGANAVNGVINIITRQAADTMGGLVTIGGGKEEQAFSAARYGWKLGDDAYARVYLKYHQRDRFTDQFGHEGSDAWDDIKGGFRCDWKNVEGDSFTLQGDMYNGDEGERLGSFSLYPEYREIVDIDKDFEGGNMLFRWNRTLSESSDMALQMYYDRTRQKHDYDLREADYDYMQTFETYDIDFQHRFAFADRHEVVWGLGYRYIRHHFDDDDSPIFAFAPNSGGTDIFSAFFQDTITLVDESLRLIIGSKFEENDYTGVEIQPTAKLLWQPTRNQVLWVSVSRAVRSPSLYENDAERVVRGVSPPSLFPPLILAEVGSEHVDAEKILAYELGYRVKPHERLALDVALFYNRYDDQIALQYGPIFVERDPEPAHNVFSLIVDNRMEAETWGVEADLRWKVTAWWKLQFAYTHMLIDADEEAFTYPPFGSDSEESYPRDQFSVRSTMDLPEGFELDLGLRYVDDLEQGVDAYVELDLRLGWQLNDKLEIALVGRNLLDRQHPEFIISRPGGYGEVDRSIFGRITWRF